MDNSHILFPAAGASASQFLLSMGLGIPQAHKFQLYSDTNINISLGDSGASRSNDQVKQAAKKLEDIKEIKRHRYAFQTRSQVDILDDGYRWRKYGQKIVKNSKFPRSYYKCTHKGCNIKKQVQRNPKDEQIVVTTYEGRHTHPIGKLTDSFEHILLKACNTSNTAAS